MYWFSEGSRPYRVDGRPEVHDPDGLALWTGAGERLWRPLNNPEHVTASAFIDDSPRGFGLLQRDRAFEHYLYGVHYEIGRASCRERVSQYVSISVVAVSLKQKTYKGD